ncbi:hypothetical protein NE237_009840 [Protea cynaroides]|uniref:Uncharacterized protein n=1 Tax=Protea cynaroides TaxID=273540 RepID=A0A9Q0R0N2_9MAGN|nr:hypothetical protein NE237_009840 [Protea cynaroides]
METTKAQPEIQGSPNEIIVVVIEPTKVQHVTKATSNQLLSKFADSDDESPAKRERVPKRQRRCRTNRDGDKENCESPSKNGNDGSLTEQRTLLPLAVTRKSTLLRQLGLSRSQLRAREIRNKSFMRSIEKTWRKTVEGASKVFIERHYNRHKRLIDDAV